MSTGRFLGISCVLLALVSVVAVGFCALSGVILTTAIAAGAGQALQVAAEGLPAWVSEADGVSHQTLNPFAPDFAQALVERIITSSDLYTQTLSEVRASPEARDVLGWPIETESVLQIRKFENSPWGAKADMTIMIRGPQASGALTVVAHRLPRLFELDTSGIVAAEARGWVYDQLLLSLDDSKDHIDLLDTVR